MRIFNTILFQLPVGGIIIGIFILTFFIPGCSGPAPIDHNTRQEFVRYLKTIDNVQDIIIEEQAIHVRIIIDSLNIGCDEEWNFKNLAFILSLSSNDKWRNYVDSNGYTLYLHRALDYEHGDFQYLAPYTAEQVADMHKQFPDAPKVVQEIKYITTHFSCKEFREMFLVLKTFESDTIFSSGDTCFSQLFADCRSNKNISSCNDIEKLRMMCDKVVKERPYPVCDSLTRHFRELDSVSTK